jgi:hypothetical protein
VIAPVLDEELRENPDDAVVLTGVPPLSVTRTYEMRAQELAKRLTDPADVPTDRALRIGERLVRKFGRKLRETICGKGGPYELFNKPMLTDKPVVSAITKAILGASFAWSSIWVPFAAVMAWVIVKTGLKVYCEPDQ